MLAARLVDDSNPPNRLPDILIGVQEEADVELFNVSGKSADLQKFRAGSGAIGALAVGALAIGALAIGALAIGRLVIGKAKIGSLKIGDLEVDTLRVRKLEVLEK
jgi:hypothetical protein